MLNPSEKWTPTERLKVIAEICRNIDKMMLPKSYLSAESATQVRRLMDTVYYVSFMGYEFLEDNRAQILADARRD